QRAAPRLQAREVDELRIGPAVHRLPAPFTPDLDRRAAVTEHAFQRRDAARRALGGRDAEVDFFDWAIDAARCCIDDGAGQRGHRARAGDRGAAHDAEGLVELTREVANEAAAVGEVDVMR